MKKIESLFIFAILCLCAVGCVEVKDTDLSISTSSYNFSESGGDLEVKISSSSLWSIGSDKDWCSFSSSSGDGDATVTITVSGNTEDLSREAKISVMGETKSSYITITQDGSGVFEVPVVFHVLYSDSNNQLQYVSYSRLKTILEEVNSIYENSGQEMNISFTLASTDENGDALTGSTPGVEYIHYTEDYPINYEDVMLTEGDSFKQYLWDPNMYVNVLVYNFKEIDENVSTFGISHLPYSIEGSNFLDGTSALADSYYTLNNLSFAYCISLNSTYIYYNSTDDTYTPADVYVTLAHELGHYLGLHHVFAEDEDGNTSEDGTIDSDYCSDTPTYSRIDYLEWMVEQYVGGVTPSFSTLALRTNGVTSATFTSTNVMDYYYSYVDEFTAEQRTRMRHVLTFSPLMPGSQKGVTSSKSLAAQGKVDLPIRVSKCNYPNCVSHSHKHSHN